MTLLLALLYAILLRITEKQSQAAWGTTLPATLLLGLSTAHYASEAVMEATGNLALASERAWVAGAVAACAILAALRFTAFQAKLSNPVARIVIAALSWAAANGVAQIAINVAGFREAGSEVSHVGMIAALVGATLGGLALAAERLILPNQVSISKAGGEATRIDKDADALYEQVGQELASGKTVLSVWTRAFAEADGDDSKARAAYIRMRIEQLKRTP